MKVLVTGAAGFIGSNFVHYLVEQRPDWDIIAIDLLTYAGNFTNISRQLEEKRIVFHKIDICDQKQIRELFGENKFDLVVNFAAESHVDRSIENSAEFIRTNVLGTENLLANCLTNKNSRFVQISTDEVYGSLGPEGRFVETTPLDPSSPYSASKAAADLLTLAYVKTHGLEALVTRCTNNYGPYQFPEKLIPLFITNALEDKPLPLYGDGMNVRSWLHVSDHCSAILKVAEAGRAGEVYNIGGMAESEIPNIEVTRMILGALGKPESLIKKVADRPGHDRRYAIDYGKINKELGWAPKTDLAQGFADTVNWYLENKEWWQSIKNGAYMDFYERLYSNRN